MGENTFKQRFIVNNRKPKCEGGLNIFSKEGVGYFPIA